jgi:hypothetical protein
MNDKRETDLSEGGLNSADSDDAPCSVPMDLTSDERDRVRATLFWLFACFGSWAALVEPIGYPEFFLNAFIKGEALGSRHFAACVAHAAGLGVDDLLSGRPPS